MKTPNPRANTPYELRVKQMRLRAKEGDAGAVAFVEKLNARVREAKLKIPQERMRGYWNKYDREAREQFRADKKLAAAGDKEAQLRVDKHRASERKWAEAKRRRQGMKPAAEALALKKAAAKTQAQRVIDRHEYYVKNKQKLTDARRAIVERAQAGDAEAVAICEKWAAQNKACWQRNREKYNATRKAKDQAKRAAAAS